MTSDPFEYRDGELYWIHNGKRAGTVSVHGYRVVTINRKKHMAHRLIWEMHNGPIPDDMEIDHINRNKVDNRIENLRVVTRAMNERNKQARGVYYDPRLKKPYWTRIRTGNEVKHLGSYSTPEEARAAYVEAKRIYHGVEL